MAVYDDQLQDTRQDNKEVDDLNEVTGISPSEEKSMEEDAAKGAREDAAEKEKLEEKEEKPNNNSDNSPEASGPKYTNTKDRGVKSWARKKTNQYIAAAIAAILTAMISGAILIAPTFILNHLGEMLKSIGNVQIDYQKRYRRKYIHKVGDIFKPEGRRSTAIMEELNTRGFRPVYDLDGKTLKGFTRNGKTVDVGDVNTFVSDHIDSKHPLKNSRWKTKRLNDFYSRYNIPRKSLVVAGYLDLDEDVTKAVNKRMAEIVLDDEPSKISNTDTPASGDESEAAESERQANNSKAKELIESDGSLDKLRNKLKDGTSISDLTNDEKAVLRIGLDFDNDLIELLNEGLFENVNLGSKLIKDVAGSALFTIPERLCSIKTSIKASVAAARIYRFRALLKYASVFISMADQTRLGGTSSKSVNEVIGKAMREDGKGRGLGGSPGIQAIIKGVFNKSRNDASKNTYSVDGKLTGIEEKLDSLTEDMVGCSVILDPKAQIGAAIGEGAIGIFTGGAGKAGFKAGAEGAEQSIRFVLKEAMSNVVKSMMTKRAAAAGAGDLLIDLSFEGAMNYLRLRVERNVALNATGQELGGDAGDLATAGGGALNKQRSLLAGQVPATTRQYAQALNEYKLNKQEEIKGKSFIARVFDYNDTDSLAFKSASLAFTSPIMSSDITSSTSNLARSVLTTPMSLFSKTVGIVTNNTYAQTNPDEIAFDSFAIGDTGIELATDFAGNIQTYMPKEIEDIDPEENIKELIDSGDINSSEPYAPKSKAFKDHVINCVEAEDTFSVIENYSDTTDPAFDCRATQKTTQKFKAHLAFMDLTDGVDATLFPEEIDTKSSSGNDQNSDNPTGSNPGGVIIGDPYSDTTEVPCAPGTKDIGLQDAYVNGTMFKSRMCSLTNFPSIGQADNPGGGFSTPGAEGFAIVNSRVSGAWYKLIEDAKASGINFTAISSFRSMPHQQALWNENPNTQFVARPGSSPHQAGVAIDFNNMSGKVGNATCANRATNSSAGYQWLRANALKYGFKQYASEAWHWDALPAENRCG